MAYQHEIEEKEVFKWCTIFNIFKLLKLFQNYNPISLTWYVTTLLNQVLHVVICIYDMQNNDKMLPYFKKIRTLFLMCWYSSETLKIFFRYIF